MTLQQFQDDIRAGIPDVLPAPKPYDPSVNHAPKRKDILTREEKVLAIKNALRYFPEKHHAELAPEFAEELERYGRIYMYRLRPDYEMYARPIEEYPARCRQAAAMMLMIQNNLDKAVAQHPHELITYGGNGAVFQNWAQYRLAMKYLSEMTEEQTLVMYSGHPMGLFPSSPDAPRAVITNGMVIPNYSKPDDWERMNALGVSQYGQMTAGSWMYIGPQGIVHGTTITVLNAGRRRMKEGAKDLGGMLFVSAGLGGMSGAQPKAGNIAGVVSIVAEINPAAVQKRYEQGWVDEVPKDSEQITKLLHIIGDYERISDHAVNIVESCEELKDKKISFSEEADKEINVLRAAVKEILDLAYDAFINNDLAKAAEIEALEQVVDDLRDKIKLNHIRRLQKSECTIEHGFVLSDILTNFERVSDHCSNIGGCVIEIAKYDALDMHKYNATSHKREEFEEKYRLYSEKYAI